MPHSVARRSQATMAASLPAARSRSTASSACFSVVVMPPPVPSSPTSASHAGVAGAGIAPSAVPLLAHTLHRTSALVTVRLPSVPSKVRQPAPGTAVTAAGTVRIPFSTSVAALAPGVCQWAHTVSPFHSPRCSMRSR